MNTDLIRRLQAAAAEHGTPDGTPPDRSLLLQEAADALAGPENLDEALAYELPPLVVDQLVHVMARMPYAGGLLTFDDDRTRTSQVVGWLEQLRARLEAQVEVHEGRERELAILLHQRHTIRAFLGLPTEGGQS